MRLYAGKYAVKKLRDGKPDYGWKKSDDRRDAFSLCLTLNEGDSEGAEHLLHWRNVASY
jgi:hypothetical protein